MSAYKTSLPFAFYFCILSCVFALVAYTLALTTPARPRELPLRFPDDDANSLGQIDSLVVKVRCGHIANLRDIPALYDIRMAYETPTENVMNAAPRPGATAVTLQRWNKVIRVVSESDDCFSVRVAAEGRSKPSQEWTGQQLGLRR